jgi:hypothetical protein
MLRYGCGVALVVFPWGHGEYLGRIAGLPGGIVDSREGLWITWRTLWDSGEIMASLWVGHNLAWRTVVKDGEHVIMSFEPRFEVGKVGEFLRLN